MAIKMFLRWLKAVCSGSFWQLWLHVIKKSVFQLVLVCIDLIKTISFKNSRLLSKNNKNGTLPSIG